MPGGATVVFVYAQDGQLLGEHDAAGAPIKEYSWLGTAPVAVFTPDAANSANPPLAYFIHTDHLDTPRVVVDSANALRWRWMAEPFGSTAAESSPSGLAPFALNLRFPGQYFDSESGLHYNWHRDYDSSIGRYVQFDPIGLAGGINGFLYAGGIIYQLLIRMEDWRSEASYRLVRCLCHRCMIAVERSAAKYAAFRAIAHRKSVKRSALSSFNSPEDWTTLAPTGRAFADVWHVTATRRSGEAAMDLQTATQLDSELKGIVEHANRALHIGNNCDDSELRVKLQEALGDAIANIDLKVWEVLYRLHPSLRPDDMIPVPNFPDGTDPT